MNMNYVSREALAGAEVTDRLLSFGVIDDTIAISNFSPKKVRSYHSFRCRNGLVLPTSQAL
jgi:hypothetical protein